MSWAIGTVTLPNSPSRIIHEATAAYEPFSNTGGTQDITATGINAETLTCNFDMHKKGYTQVMLFGSYVSPLRAYLYSAVTVDFPITYHNGTWLMTECTPDLNNEEPEKVTLTITFVRGGNILVL